MKHLLLFFHGMLVLVKMECKPFSGFVHLQLIRQASDTCCSVKQYQAGHVHKILHQAESCSMTNASPPAPTTLRLPTHLEACPERYYRVCCTLLSPKQSGLICGEIRPAPEHHVSTSCIADPSHIDRTLSHSRGPEIIAQTYAHGFATQDVQ